MYKVGDRFSYTNEFNSTYNEEYILALVDNYKVALIGLKSGNRWANPVHVNNHQIITEIEFSGIATSANDESFIKVSA